MSGSILTAGLQELRWHLGICLIPAFGYDFVALELSTP
jgi:hypothetical protein